MYITIEQDVRNFVNAHDAIAVERYGMAQILAYATAKIVEEADACTIRVNEDYENAGEMYIYTCLHPNDGYFDIQITPSIDYYGGIVYKIDSCYFSLEIEL